MPGGLIFALKCTIMKVRENQVKLKLNETHQLPVYADDENLLGDNIGIINKTQKLYLTLVRRLDQMYYG
jgi:hypothetical protein